MAERREVVEHADAAGCLLQREMAHVADEQDELFLVVGPSGRLGRGLADDNARLLGRRSACQAGAGPDLLTL